ncbi:hypothetical protein IC608_15010 [Devosia sp. PTR5]|uniref:Uncharacterized protein n=1 Tax=Devosia oryzisoli TaxID=2774138 RepID=A0A927IUC7_9HYPH|nr:hypothetical protein [Devosia oryzisoli]MBD8066782.1 hypothetical protein [Devosia oryzisoli]
MLFAVLGLSAAAGGGYVASQEASQYFFSGVSSAEATAALVDGRPVPGFSSDAREAYAELCLLAAPSLSGRMLAADAADRLDRSCMKTVAALAADNPVDAFMPYAEARLAYQDNDEARFSAALLQSNARAPNEYWLVIRRVELSERGFAMLDAAAQAAELRDIAVLASTRSGSRALAGRYVVNPSFRERVTKVIEQLPVEQQGQFLSYVRLIGQGSGGRQ